MNANIQQKPLQFLLREIEAIKRSIGKARSKQLRSPKIKDNIRSFIYTYFGRLRPELISFGLIETHLEMVDLTMQDLLRCTQRSTLKNVYFKYLDSMRKHAYELELKSITPITGGENIIFDQKEQRILETLEKISPSAAASYGQALLDLQSPSRKSWRGTAVELREALRELLDVMAPDDDISAQPGFKLEPNTKGPTMKQRVVFILQSRGLPRSQQKAPAEAIEVADTQVGKFVRSVYDRSSAGAHSQISKSEVMKIKEYATLALTDLLEIG